MLFDTIAAISTATGGAISIVRVSGSKAIDISNQICDIDLPAAEDRYMNRCFLHLFESERVFDDALICVMRGPNNFTGEDTVEIYTHGGSAAAKTTLSQLISAGCRQAQPGEFTRRAYINGRIDLTKAEAISDIIGAKTVEALTLAAGHLKGSLVEKTEGLRRRLISLAAHLSAILDYPEEGVPDITLPETYEQINILCAELEGLVKTADQGVVIMNGLNVVIAGKPNTGKSSLLNLLLGQDRAIVTSIEGTTRDVLREQAIIEGYLVNLWDTAGIRKTDDIVENAGIERTKKSLESAHLVLVVQDAGRPLDSQDNELLTLTEGMDRLVVINKQDIKEHSHHGDLYISAATGEGVDELCKKIADLASVFEPKEDTALLTNERQRGIALRTLSILQTIPNSGLTIDLVLCELEAAIGCLNELTGINVSEEIIETVFANFCVGK